MDLSVDLPEAEAQTLAASVQPVVTANDTVTDADPSCALSPSYAEDVLHSTTIAEPASIPRDVEAVTRDMMQPECSKRQRAAVDKQQSLTTATMADQRDPPVDALEEAASPTDPVNSASKDPNIASVSAPPPDLSTLTTDQGKLPKRHPAPASDQTSSASNAAEPRAQAAADNEKAELPVADNFESCATARDIVPARCEELLPASSDVKTADLQISEQRVLPKLVVTDLNQQEMPNTVRSEHAGQVSNETISREPAVKESPIIVDSSALESPRGAAIPVPEHALQIVSSLQEAQPSVGASIKPPTLPMSPKVSTHGETLLASPPGSPSTTPSFSYPNQRMNNEATSKITPDAILVDTAEGAVLVADMDVPPLTTTSADVGAEEGLGSCASYQFMLNTNESSTLTAAISSEGGTSTESGAQDTLIGSNESKLEIPVPPLLETAPPLGTEEPNTEAASTGLNNEEQSSRLVTAASAGAGLPEAVAKSALPITESDNGQPKYEFVNATEPSKLSTDVPLVFEQTDAGQTPADAEPVVASVPDALEISSTDSAAEADRAATSPAESGVERFEQVSANLVEDPQPRPGPPTLLQTAAEMSLNEIRGVEPESGMVESTPAQSAPAEVAPEEAASTTEIAEPDAPEEPSSIMEHNAMEQSDGVSSRQVDVAFLLTLSLQYLSRSASPFMFEPPVSPGHEESITPVSRSPEITSVIVSTPKLPVRSPYLIRVAGQSAAHHYLGSRRHAKRTAQEEKDRSIRADSRGCRDSRLVKRR